MAYLILVAGAPASGKTNFAEYLSEQLKLPMISKDSIKEILFENIGFKSRTEKVALSAAAMEIMCCFAERHFRIGQSVILESNFENINKLSLERLVSKFYCKTLTILFSADIDVLADRFVKRDSSPERHRGHVVNTQYPEDDTFPFEFQTINPVQFQQELEQRGILNFSIGEDIVHVDTTDFSKVSYDTILHGIREKIGADL